MLERIRWFVALLVVVSVPPAVLYWYVIHPFADFWRRRGPALTFTVVFSGYLGLVIALFLLREPLLAVDLGFQWPLAIIGFGLYSMAAFFEIQTRRHLKFKILVGLPELDPEGAGIDLMTEGIYARSRNPRYFGFMLGLLAMAFALNYLTVWLYALVMPIVLYGLVRMEEWELEARYGEQYLEYCARTPRFVPRPLFGAR